MNWTTEDLKRFAEVGGWKIQQQCPECVSPHLITLNPRDKEDLIPDFPNDLAACFEVLEYVRGNSEEGDFTLHTTVAGYRCRINRYKPELRVDEFEHTKQDAIIAAVLKAKAQ